MPKFKFAGHERPFWLTDFPGRIRITIDRNDGAQTNRRDCRREFFYADNTTVGQVAEAVWQALFVPDEEAAKLAEEHKERRRFEKHILQRTFGGASAEEANFEGDTSKGPITAGKKVNDAGYTADR